MKVWIYLALLAGVLASTFASKHSSKNENNYLLPKSVRPNHYDVSLAFSLDQDKNFPFFGVVDIEITALQQTKEIFLHSQGLQVEDMTIEATSGHTLTESIKGKVFDEENNFLILNLDKSLKAGANYTLTIPFSGNLKPGLDGVYISTYTDKKTKQKEYLIATQFEAISARKGFPCFDEPMYKSTFNINLGHHTKYTATSNMPKYNSTTDNIIEQNWSWETINQKFNTKKDSFVWDLFETSVPMSTYLVAWVVSKFAYVVSNRELSTAEFKIWARADAIEQTEYASEIGPKILTNYESWFNVTFPLPKQDMFAIPDFAAGAMENWGLITYRETALLYDKDHSSFVNKERVAEVIAHELAHQWFGNLVTMKWWSDLWLNEGFATYVASIGINSVEPDWQVMETDAVANMLSLLALDSLESSHPVSVSIDDPKRIQEIFDEISYKKGAILIRMMYMFLGEDVFRKAINSYLIKYSYKNAEQDDLWEELTTSTREHKVLTRDVTVKQIMDTWTTQTGYPILTVERDYTDQSLLVTQKRYLAVGTRSQSNSAWWVPLNVICESDPPERRHDPIQWLSDKEGVDKEHRFEHGANDTQWVLFNADMLAPYRVNYDKKNWDHLINTLNSKRYMNIPTLSRVQLLSDAFALSFSNDMDYNTVFSLVNYLEQETEYLPLETGLSALNKIDLVLKRSSDYGVFQEFVKKLVTPAYMRAGGLHVKKIVNEEDLLSVKMQTLTSKWACYVGDENCEANAIALFDQWMQYGDPDQNSPIPLDLRPVVWCKAAARGSQSHWRFLLTRAQRSNVAAARVAALSALTCTSHVWLLNQYLEWTISNSSEIRRQDAAMVIAGVMRSTVGYYVARDFFMNRIDEIHNAFYGQSRRLGSLIKVMLDQFTTQKELDDFIKWKDNNSKYLEESTLAVHQAIEKASVNIGWIEKNKNQVINILRNLTT